MARLPDDPDELRAQLRIKLILMDDPDLPSEMTKVSIRALAKLRPECATDLITADKTSKALMKRLMLPRRGKSRQQSPLLMNHRSDS